ANSVRFQLSTGDPVFIHLVLIICSPLPIGLVLCSVLAVMIWRYSRQMGGGLVAKAWKAIMLYMLVLPVRTVLVGVGSGFISRGSHWNFLIGVVSYLGLALAVWGVYLGASYQYEASTQSESFEQGEAAGLSIPR
ncbi:MAG TPA: hypothetical protein VEZ90_19005, partial [Blastocatellia bacterium]|nr:hypothetical protein [Blastocatellia bacterium]